MIIRAILPQWAADEDPRKRRVYEGEFSHQRIRELNTLHYNIYYLPNFPLIYNPGKTVDGSDIDKFKYVFVDCDLKDGVYPDKVSFIDAIFDFPLKPSIMVDSGNGIHAYWEVTDLDAMSYLRLQRRLLRRFNTDEAVGQIYQLMRLPGTYNTKLKGSPIKCLKLLDEPNTYSSEELSKVLPIITKEDEEYCQQHYNKTYDLNTESIDIDEKLPVKFGALLKDNQEVKDIWIKTNDDRSKADYRLAHILHGTGFTRDEALSVLVNSAKALERAPKHRVTYAVNIVDKVWTYEIDQTAGELTLSSTVKDILSRSGTTLKGTRFRCHRYIDDTAHGFRLGQVIGLVAGSGVGKTAVALDMFRGFVEFNPDYEHFVIPLEQPANEIADRWKSVCGDNISLHDKVHVLSNYDENGNFRHLSLDEIREYLNKFKKITGKKIGCVVIDHIGALKKKGKAGENQDLMDICHSMKAFAIETNTLLVMQSQSNREKAGIGDLELNKDAAYGTVFFESYCDYLITMWQPLKRCYKIESCPTVTALKFCKIRHKKQGLDYIQEDTPYILKFDATTERLRTMTQDEENQFDYFNKQATNLRKQDRKTDLVTYTSLKTETH